MYHFNVGPLFFEDNNKENFLKTLNDHNVQHDPDTLEEICKDLTQYQSKVDLYGATFLKYLLAETPSNTLLMKLTLIQKYFVTYLADEPEYQEIRLIVFSACLKVKNSQQDLFDAQVHHLVYILLSKCHFTADIWEKEVLKLSSTENMLKLQELDMMIEEYIYNPRYYPTITLPTDNQDLLDAMCIRLSLFNILYEEELRPLEFKNDTIHFSDAWVKYLKAVNRVKSPSIIKTQLIETSLRCPESTVKCYSLVIPNRDEPTIEMGQLNRMMRESCQSLIYSHPKFVPVISFALLLLLQFAVAKCTRQEDQYYNSMVRATWLRIVTRLFDEAVFENKDLKKSTAISTLIKYCACLIQYRNDFDQLRDEDLSRHLKAIWDHFYNTRMVYLRSTKNSNTKDLQWLQKIYFISSK